MSIGKISAWAWQEFGEDAKSGFFSFLKRKLRDASGKNEVVTYLEKGWHEFNWSQAKERYKEHMQDLYGHTRIIGTAAPIPISDIFTDVYVLDKPQAYQRFDITQLQELQKEPKKLQTAKRERGLRIVVNKENNRIYILGKPGAGKTTFMKYLVQQTITADELDKLPIFVTLRDWDANKVQLIDFIAKQFEICQFPQAKAFIEYILLNGYALVLFDGLDEVPEQNNLRKSTTRAMQDFSKMYQKSQIIITCRIAAVDYTFDDFTYIEMAEFSKSQANA